jgi:endonuclease G
MEERFQPDDAIFSSAMQRGHLFKREDAVWGADEQTMRRADEHSFTITNATPMIANFNNVEWGDLEDIITRECQAGNKISYFAGPVFRSTDRFFNELRLDVPPSERRTGMRVPESFWKIVAWVEDSSLKAAGFMLHQTDEIEQHGPIMDEIDFGNYRQVPIGNIEEATGLRFPGLKAADTLFDEHCLR